MTINSLIQRLSDVLDPATNFAGLFKYLEESEQQALALIEYVKHPNDPPPKLPANGSIEAGFLLYWIHYPPQAVEKWIDEHEVIKIIFEALQSEAPPTKITTAEYDFVISKIETVAVPWDDGTLIGTKKYEQLDSGWILAGLNYAMNLVDSDLIYHPLPAGSNLIKPLSGKSGGDPVIGIIGDWGTGFFTEDGVECAAKRVIDDIAARPIDYLMHLGDVYYSGTDWRPLPGEELLNLVNTWPDQGAQRNFTLNSNHEMCGGAQGYFEVALKSSLFQSQDGASYFACSYGSWLVLAIDSAYYSDAENGDKMYMEGAIGTTTNEAQIEWLQNFRNHEGPVIIFSHHNPCDPITAHTNVLFDQVHQALGKMPDVWYWGHVHNGIVYTQLHLGNSFVFVPTKGRCCGHASIPFGNAWGLEDNPNVAYYAHTPDPAYPPASPRVLNGYATVQLHQDGSFTESFYEVGVSEPKWHKTWSTR